MALAILIILLPVIIYSSSAYVSLYRGSGRNIPSNLPWYPLIVFGDNRPSNVYSTKYSKVFYKIVYEMKEISPLAVIGTGDHTGTGSNKQIDYFIETMSGLDNVWVCLGNHDLTSNDLNYWTDHVAPEYYYIDAIPSWRIVFVNEEDSDIHRFKLVTESMLDNTNRSIILVVHKPLYPDVKHNLQDDEGDIFQILIHLINRYNVKLVLQGHWHGFASKKINGVEYIITAGAGAPLYYKPNTVENAVIVTGKYHYMILILYPDGKYTYTPVDASAGNIEVKRLNETTILIYNTKLDLWGKPIQLPIRIKLTAYNKTYDVVLMANHGYTILSYAINRNKLIVKTNSTNWYIYNNTEKNPDMAIIPKETTVIEKSELLDNLIMIIAESSVAVALAIYLQKRERK